MGAFNSFHFYQSAVHHSSVLKIFGMAQQVKGRLMWSKNPPKQTNKKKTNQKKPHGRCQQKGSQPEQATLFKSRQKLKRASKGQKQAAGKQVNKNAAV